MFRSVGPMALAIPIFLGAFIFAPGGALAQEPWRPNPKSAEPVSPRLERMAAENPGKTLKAWVYFTDKGITSDVEYLRARTGAEAKLEAHAEMRRMKMGLSSLVGFHDLPVVTEYVDAVIATGARRRAITRYLNGMSAEAPIEILREIAGLPFVRSVEPVMSGRRRPVTPDRPAPAPAAGKASLYGLNYGDGLGQVEMMQVPTLHDLGLDGTGVRICLLDTGFKRTHNALTSVNVIDEWDFINDDPNTSEEPGDPSGQFGHGTKVLSLIAGYDPGALIGPAYNAEFLLGKTEDTSQEEPIEEDWWVEGIEWADAMGADIVSSSLGYKDWYTYEDMDGNTATTTIAADLAAGNGILVCTSAGNEGEGSWDYIIAPADADSIIATGAVWDDTTLVYFSSRGPTYDGRIKPDLVAQGVYTVSVDPYSNTAYDDCHGTSCANPLLAGAAALVLQANPFQTPYDLIERLKSTATRAASPDTAYGWGLIQAADAFDLVTSVQAEEDLEAYGREPVPAPPALTVTAAPNPFNPTVTLSIHVRSTGVLKVRLFDARGALVDTLHYGNVEMGGHQVVWDGKDRSGRDAPSGVYFAIVEGAGLKVVKKLSLVR
ncbi:MAG: S8 family serine peptidase [Candidatus Eisenbacteria bacterium]